MIKLRRLWNLMWKEKSNKRRTWGMTIFFSVFAFFTSTGFQVTDSGIVFHETHWVFTLIPICLYLTMWIGSYISFNKRGVLDHDLDLTKKNRLG
jgi:hypothetical protein